MTLHEKLVREYREDDRDVRSGPSPILRESCPRPTAPDPEGEAKDDAAYYVELFQEADAFGYVTLPSGEQVEPDSERSPLRRAGLI